LKIKILKGGIKEVKNKRYAELNDEKRSIFNQAIYVNAITFLITFYFMSFKISNAKEAVIVDGTLLIVIDIAVIIAVMLLVVKVISLSLTYRKTSTKLKSLEENEQNDFIDTIIESTYFHLLIMISPLPIIVFILSNFLF